MEWRFVGSWFSFLERRIFKLPESFYSNLTSKTTKTVRPEPVEGWNGFPLWFDKLTTNGKPKVVCFGFN
ncbi:hypothetical protein V6W75_03570 [Mannheimia sp. HC-2023]|uniref:hypothetical protein n=1 Tax=Mannheimia indoligenes TaxID=3103145 RepID=UPI002FE5E202